MKALLLLVISSLFSISIYAATFVVGDNIGHITLQDQFAESYATNADTSHLLFSRSMKGGTIIEEALMANATLYENPNLLYIADISGMPSLISRFVAIPGFKKFPFKLALDKEGAATQSIPSADDQATLLLLDQGKIISINYFYSKESLLEALQ